MSDSKPSGSPDHPGRAMYYQKQGVRIRCELCPNFCSLADGELGRCRARKHIGGEMRSLVYGQLVIARLDPIEKKPFFHVLPGTEAYSIATPGCNMRCLFCQNWEISQANPQEARSATATPEEVVDAALRTGAPSIAFTYTEPSIFYEYMLDIAKLAKKKGLKTVVVSNGYINPEPLRNLLKYIDAYKIDLKAFNEPFYQEITGGNLASILNTLQIIDEEGVWLEIVTLLIPGQNDSEQEIRALSKWVYANLGPDVPLHFSRFHPQYKLQQTPPTPIETVIRARQIAMEEGLRYVYTGNIPYPEGESTYHPQSGKIVIERRGYFVVHNHLKDGTSETGGPIPGVWK